MPDRLIKLRELRRILRRYGVVESPERGKGSHTLFSWEIDGKRVNMPMPTSKPDIPGSHVRRLRVLFRLTADDGVSDRDFYES